MAAATAADEHFPERVGGNREWRAPFSDILEIIHRGPTARAAGTLANNPVRVVARASVAKARDVEVAIYVGCESVRHPNEAARSGGLYRLALKAHQASLNRIVALKVLKFSAS